MNPMRPDGMEPDAEIRNRLRTLLPLWGEDHPLPERFILDVPYLAQEREYFSGAACVQMICAFHGRKYEEQSQIMQGLGVGDFRDIKHESFEVLISDYVSRKAQLLPSHYSPAIHIAPKMGDGIAATDFIRGQPQVRYISSHDYYVFKRLLTARNAPLIVRIHFTTDMYPMAEEIAERLDITGHAIVIVGYNEFGFIIHDPWDNSRFGGNRGGAQRLVPFNDFRDTHLMVNCSLEDAEMADELGLHFEHLPQAVYPNRDISGRLALFWPGIEGVAANRWAIDDVIVDFSTASSINFHESRRSVSNVSLRPGQIRYIPFTINTGDRIGSFQISAEVKARLVSPTFRWVVGHRAVDEVFEASCSYRVSVQDTSWFQQYAMP